MGIGPCWWVINRLLVLLFGPAVRAPLLLDDCDLADEHGGPGWLLGSLSALKHVQLGWLEGLFSVPAAASGPGQGAEFAGPAALLSQSGWSCTCTCLAHLPCPPPLSTGTFLRPLGPLPNSRLVLQHLRPSSAYPVFLLPFHTPTSPFSHTPLSTPFSFLSTSPSPCFLILHLSPYPLPALFPIHPPSPSCLHLFPSLPALTPIPTQIPLPHLPPNPPPPIWLLPYPPFLMFSWTMPFLTNTLGRSLAFSRPVRVTYRHSHSTGFCPCGWPPHP